MLLVCFSCNQLARAHFPIYVVFPVFAERNVTSFRAIHKTGLNTYTSHEILLTLKRIYWRQECRLILWISQKLTSGLKSFHGDVAKIMFK